MARPTTTYANQSVPTADLLNAFKLVLRLAGGLAARKVIECYEDRRPAVEAAGHTVWFRWVLEDLDEDSGAGRHGIRNDVLMEVNLVTRMFADGAGRDERIGREHLDKRHLIVNALDGQMLFDAYDEPAGGEPPKPTQEANVLTVAAMSLAKLPKADRPRPEQGYIESRIGVKVPVVLRLTLNSVPVMEDRDYPATA